MSRLGSVFPEGVVSTHRGVVPTEVLLGAGWTVVLTSESALDQALTTLSQNIAETFAKDSGKSPGLILFSNQRISNILSDLRVVLDKCEALEEFYVVGPGEFDRGEGPLDFVDPITLQIALGSAIPLQGLCVFIVGPDHRIKLSLSLPDAALLSVDELQSSLQALMLTDTSMVSTPADWRMGEPVVVNPELSDLEATERFGPIRRIFAYLRFVAMPKSSLEER